MENLGSFIAAMLIVAGIGVFTFVMIDIISTRRDRW